METEELMSDILNAIPYPVVFIDCSHTIRYMNNNAKYTYYTERGYGDLIGKSLFEFHDERSLEKILSSFKMLEDHISEVYLGVNLKNQRMYMTAVRNQDGELIGYFERFEMNLQK